MHFEIPAILFDASIRSLCLALAAWIALRLFRVRESAQRHTVWTVVLCTMLLMPLLVPVLPALRLRVLPVRPATSAALLAPLSAAPGIVSTAPIGNETSPPLPAVAIVYGIVALAMILHLAAGWILSRRLLRRSAILEDARVHGVIVDIAPTQHLPTLRELSLLTVPVSFGWLNPVVLLPDTWRSWDDAKLRAVLAHELAHVGRRDALVALIAAVNRCVFWFHPLSWWLVRHLAALAEQVSDDSAILATGDRHKYAQVLVEIAGSIGNGNRRLLTGGLAMARTTQVSRRVERILALRHEAAHGSRWLLVAIALPLIYAAAAVQLAPGQPPPPPSPARPAVQTPFPRQADLDLLGQAAHTSAGDAARLEQQLKQQPDDIGVRAKLMAHYALKGMPQQRHDHIFWLIENRPEAEVFDSRVCYMGPDEGLGNDSASYERAAALWISQAERHATNARVQVNAAGAIQSTDPLRSESFLVRARTLEPQNLGWTERLAALYVAAIAGSPGTFFAAKARIVLDASNDASLVGAAGDNLLPIDANIMRARSPEDMQFGLRLLTKAQSLAPDNIRWTFALKRLEAWARMEQRGPGAPPPPPPPPAVLPVTYVQPEYPPLAREARIQGAVIFTAVIGTDGRVARLRLVSGHPLLVSAAQTAVQEWVFPTSPAEVTTTVEVPFWLDQTALIGGTLYVRAEYPPLARQARIEGTVRLKAVMGPDGSITNVEVVSGHPLLIPAAQKAVREGVYPNFAVGPIVIEVPFRIDPADARWSEQVRAFGQARAQQQGAVPPLPPPPPPATEKGSDVSRTLEQPLTKVPPVYPPLARQARIRGTVRLKIVVGADGSPASIQLVTGHPLLVPAAQEAVRQWTFRTNSGGVPIEIEIPFRLDEPGNASAPPAPMQGGTLYVTADYPPDARQARIQGTVRFSVVLGADGRVTKMELVSGHPMLVPAAQKAVAEGVFPAGAGEKIPVEVPFRLDQ